MKLAEANKLTLQQACDYVIDRLVEQDSQCKALVHGTANCVYGNAEGQHCAIGWLMDESNEILMAFEGGVESLNSEHYGIIPGILHTHENLFDLIQTFHDSDYMTGRLDALIDIKSYDESGVSFDNPNWEKWVSMGKEYKT